MNKLIKVGNYNKKFNDLLGINITQEEIFRSSGLSTDVIKSNRENCLKYIACISDIIENPDYVGVNPNESCQSIELVKKYENNVLLGMKVDSSNNFLYVSTLFNLQESKLQRRIHSGRLVKYEK